ncbi:hypothetical protein CR956_00010 [Candidatus Saccharibacteria bacterium]|nr:MAG: hypothetical protein CR956_00010 [Candidatus Saccharibacteria bacterium]
MDSHPDHLSDENTDQNRLVESANQHRIVVLVIGSLFVAFVLVSLAMTLYNSSGAAQLDLSRPEYQSVVDGIEHKTDLDKYPSSGAVSKKALKDFEDLYQKRTESIIKLDAFGGDTLSDEALGLPKID